ncbi:MAG: MAPEG family protein [Beijerinckiaceae bacterium]|nr:MAPEG family protein [Beijerinckiaceae bacterium]
MSIQAILLPLFVQVAVTFVLGFWLARLRWGLVLRKEVRWQDIALRQKPWPDRAEQVGYCFQNQFETPIVFYALVILAILTKKADIVIVTMEWLFVAARVAHAYIHTTSNYVPLRGQFYIAGVIVLFLMWVYFALLILAAPLTGLP